MKVILIVLVVAVYVCIGCAHVMTSDEYGPEDDNSYIVGGILFWPFELLINLLIKIFEYFKENKK